MPESPPRKIRAALVLFGLLWSPGAWALATCQPWHANVSVTPLDGKQSKAFEVTWDTSAPAIACLNGANPMWNGIDHYEVHRISAASDPFATESYYDIANRVAVVGAGINTVNNFVHRSNARFYYRVYACEGAGSCASFYGDGTGLASESTYYRSDFDHTDFERYSLTGITGPDDGALGVVVDNDAIAAHAVFFPPSWGSGLSNKMMLYWGVSGNDVSPSHVYAMLHDVEGWPSGGFNGSGDWGAEHVVAKGSMTTTDDEYRVYWKQYGTDQFFVSYWTPTGWAEWYDASGSPTSMEEVYFFWDGSSSDGPSPECMGDLAAITKVWGGTFHDGMFFQVLDQYVCPEVWLANHPEETTAPTDLVGFDNDASSVTKDGAIVFAELTN